MVDSFKELRRKDTVLTERLKDHIALDLEALEIVAEILKNRDDFEASVKARIDKIEWGEDFASADWKKLFRGIVFGDDEGGAEGKVGKDVR